MFQNVLNGGDRSSLSNLRTLAEHLGLSITTVSRALDGYDDVAKATRERVCARARELNYQPNAAARSLRRQRSNAVAVTLPARTSAAGVSGLFSMLMDASVHFAQAGFDLMIVPTPSVEGELASLRRLIDGRRVDAVVLVRTRCTDARVSLLEDAGIPFVTHGRTASHKPHAFIDGDGRTGFYDATKALIGLGHSRIAHIAGPKELMFSRLRRQGWSDAMMEAGIDPRLEDSVAAPTESEGYAAAQRLFAAPQPPTALVCATDMMAVGAIAAAKDSGLRAGRDISIVGHDGLELGEYCDPPLSTMRIDAGDVGGKLAHLLLERMNGRDPRDLQMILPVRQVPRASHGPNRSGT